MPDIVPTMCPVDTYSIRPTRGLRPNRVSSNRTYEIWSGATSLRALETRLSVYSRWGQGALRNDVAFDYKIGKQQPGFHSRSFRHRTALSNVPQCSEHVATLSRRFENERSDP